MAENKAKALPVMPFLEGPECLPFPQIELIKSLQYFTLRNTYSNFSNKMHSEF